MRSKLILCIGASAIALAAAGCGGSSSAGSGGTITIGALVYQTGPLARKGSTNNLKMAVDELNQAGGVSGHKVRLKLYDVGGITPQQGRTAAQKAIADRPTVLIGPSVSAQTNAIADLLPSAKVPMINLSAQRETDPGQPKGNKWLFRLNQRTDREAEALAQTVAGRLHAKNVVVTHSTDDTTTYVSNIATKLLKAKGVNVTKVVTYAPDATDLTNPALATRGADAVLVTGYPQPEALLIKQMRANGIKVPVVFDYGAESVLLGGLASGSDLNNASFLGSCEPAATTGVNPVAKAYMDKYASTYPGSYVNGYYYDAVKIIAEGVKLAGDLDPEKLRTGLASIKGYKGVCGDATADSDQNYQHTLIIVKMDGGKPAYGGQVDGLTGSY